MLSGVPPVLECRGVTAGYGGVQVLFGVDMRIQRGEVVALLGANGAGKTTFLRVLSGLEPAWDGGVWLNSQPLGNMAAFRRVTAGICQIVGGESIAEGLTVGEHLRLWASSLEGGASPEVLAELDEVEGGGPLYHQAMQKLGADGWLGIGWPKEHGGQGRGPIEQFIFFDEVQRAGFPVPILTLNTVGPTLLKFGTAEQKAKYPPKILEGKCHFSIGYTEPDSVTDLASLKTSAPAHDPGHTT